MIPVEEKQNVRLNLKVSDYVGNVVGDSSYALMQLNISLQYSNGDEGSLYKFDCSTECIDGNFDGPIDLSNDKEDLIKV